MALSVHSNSSAPNNSVERDRPQAALLGSLVASPFRRAPHVEPLEIQGKKWFKVSVECDTQEFMCKCPTIEKARPILEVLSAFNR